MAASWPTSVKSFTRVVNGVTKLVAALYNSAYDEIEAIETWLSSMPAYIKVSEVQAANTNGGTFTLGAWRTRVINTEDNDTGGYCTIGSNQITLLAGTYECFITAPARQVTLNKIRLYNITDGATTLLGENSYAEPTYEADKRAILRGRFTIAATKVFEIQHWGTSTANTVGFGTACNIDGTSEVYTVAEFRKMA